MIEKLQKPRTITQEPNNSWQYWKLICEAGRQRWVFNPPEEPSEKEKFSPDYYLFLDSMSSDFIFDKSENPNTSDLVYFNSIIKPEIPHSITGRFDNSLMYPNSLSMKADKSAFMGIRQLSLLQHPDGHWPGDYGGPLFLLPALIFASHITSVNFPDEKRVLMTRYMLNHQNSDGGWGLHIEGDSTMFGTTMQYCALRILGMDQDIKALKNAQIWILENGGLESIPSWGKFFMSLLGIYEWEGCNSLLPELWLLPRWVPFHPGRYWCHARMVYLPMAYCYGKRIHAEIDPLILSLRKELYKEDYESINWNNSRNRVADSDLYRGMNPGLKTLFRLTSLYEKHPINRWREKALRYILEYINAEDKQTNYIDIGPVNQIINSICIWKAYGADSEAFRKHVSRWDDYLWVAEDGMKMNGYNGSQLWDTAFSVQSMLENPDSGVPSEVLTKAYDFIEENQIQDEVIERSRFYRHPSVGGWPFSTREHGWPISDCTAEGLKAVLKLHRSGIRGDINQDQVSDERLQQAVDLILSFQNTDKGWGTYENNRGGSWLEYINPSDIFGEIMIDYSWVECSSACITALVEFQLDYPEYRSGEIKHAILNGLQFLKKQQRNDGSWIGSWGVCFTYGTWFGVEAIAKSKAYMDDMLPVQRACDFLVSKQGPDGGWGESYLSCSKEQYMEHEKSQVIQTSWALLALMAAEYPDRSVIDRGISLLRARQLENGAWPQEGISGVFNKTCMITYSAYRNVFPIWALERYVGAYSRNFRNGSARKVKKF